MKEFKGTKWAIDNPRINEYRVFEIGSGCICEHIDDYANATLIAAAPDLLEALQMIRYIIPAHLTNTIEHVDRVINKALTINN